MADTYDPSWSGAGTGIDRAKREVPFVSDMALSANPPSKAASLGTLASVVMSIVGIVGQVVFGGNAFTITAAFGFSILAAIVLAHSR